jgi:NADH:ubiquinone oxidoreductase subunit K
MIYLCLVLFLFFCWAFYQNFYSILNLLIILEGIILRIIVFNYSCSLILYARGFIMLLLLTFAACEAALGLSILVRFLRVRRNNQLSNMSSTNWFAKNSCYWEYKVTSYTPKNFYLMKWGFYFRITSYITNFDRFFFINTLYIWYF